MSKKRSRRQRSRSRQPIIRREGRVAHVRPPTSRLKPIFKTLDAVAVAVDRAALETAHPDQTVGRFDFNVLLRGVNAMKSMRILLAQAHWEVAAAPVRQLFELVVNAEYIKSQTDREKAALRFMKFGLLQLARGQLAAIDYAAASGRDVDEERRRGVEAHVDSTYAEFRGKNGGWQRTWSGKSTRQLAELSPHPLRVAQYELLFTAWSEQVHASPGALVDTFFTQATGSWIEEAVASDDLHIAETASVGVALFIDLWTALPAVPAFDPEAAWSWTETLLAESEKLGAPPLGR